MEEPVTSNPYANAYQQIQDVPTVPKLEIVNEKTLRYKNLTPLENKFGNSIEEITYTDRLNIGDMMLQKTYQSNKINSNEPKRNSKVEKIK